MASVISGDANVSAAEFGYLDGVTSALQTQINAKLPIAGGKILQVVAATTSTVASSSSSTYADTGLTATITPSSATSKVLIMALQNGCVKGTNDTRILLRLLRGATSIAQVESIAGFNSSGTNNAIGSIGTNFLDTPATTSAVTYKTQFGSQGNNAAVTVQADSNNMSSMVLMEVSA